MAPSTVSRRGFLASLLIAPVAGFLRSSPGLCGPLGDVAPVASDHPKPRPGVNASRVPTANELRDAPKAIRAFDEVRQIPQIVDGIRCHCGCAKLEGFYSLLSCYEGPDPMAKMCDVCQGQGRYAYRLHRSGKSLDAIRAAIDARYG